MSALAREIAKFRRWADAAGSHPGCSGEWECGYPAFQELYAAVATFLESAADRALGRDELELLLYALARDNEDEHILETMERYPRVAMQAAETALSHPDTDARWQAAVLLGRIGTPQATSLLRRFLGDDAEYVRRRAGFALQELES